MTSRTEEAYTFVVMKLRELGLAVTKLVTDFERAQLLAWRRCYGGARNFKHSGCLFHYVRAIYRAVGRLGLCVFMRTNEHARRLLRRISALPRLPAARIGEGFTAIWQEVRRRGIGVYNEVYRFLLYVFNQWLVAVRPRNLSVWRQYHATNNTCETHHEHLDELTHSANPGSYDVVGKETSFIKNVHYYS